MTEEIWKPVTADPYTDLYSVSNLGRVKRTKRCRRNGKVGRVLIPFVDKKGYHWVVLRHNYQARRFSVHKLVALAFIGEVPDGKEIDHIDRSKDNNNHSNLRYISHHENILHKWI